MVGLANLELESKLKKATTDQVAFLANSTKGSLKLSRDLGKLAERTDNSIQELTEKTKLTFKELLQRADKTDDALSHILQQLSIVANAKTSDSLRSIITSTQEVPLLDKVKKKRQVSTSNQEAFPSSVAVPKPKPLIPKVLDDSHLPHELKVDATTIYRRLKFSSSTPHQLQSATSYFPIEQ